MKKIKKIANGLEKKLKEISPTSGLELKHYGLTGNVGDFGSPNEGVTEKNLNTYGAQFVTPHSEDQKNDLLEPVCASPLKISVEIPSKQKLPVTLSQYKMDLHEILLAEFNMGNKSDDFYLTLHKKCKTLKKAAQKLSLQQSDTDFMEWITGVRILLSQNSDSNLPVLGFLTVTFGKMEGHLISNVLHQDYLEEFWKSVEHVTEKVFTEVLAVKICDILTPITSEADSANSLSPLLDAALTFLGLIWNHFEEKTVNVTPLLEEMDSIARVHMETLLERFETLLATEAKKLFLAISSEPKSDLLSLCSCVPRLNAKFEENMTYWKHVLSKYKIKIDLYEHIYSVWDLEISETVKPILQNAKESLVPLLFEESYPILSQNFDDSADKSLFSLYKSLQVFASLTKKAALVNIVQVKGSLYTWFRPFVPHWIDAICYGAMSRTDKAVKLDDLTPISENCKRSFSSVATVEIFISMENSWEELQWKNPEEIYGFAILTLQNFDRCIRFYAESMYNRVQELEKDFEYVEVSDEFYVAINNVEYVTVEVEPIVERFSKAFLDQLSKTLQKGNERRSSTSSMTSLEQCLQTPTNIVQNWTENVTRKSSNCVLWTYEKQIEPLLCTLLQAATSCTDSERDSDRFVCHLNGIFENMKTKLKSPQYARAFPTIAEKILQFFLDFGNRNLRGSKSISFFEQLEVLLSRLCQLFQEKGLYEIVSGKDEEIRQFHDGVQLHKKSTQELIVEYFRRRHDASKSCDQNSIQGTLTVIPGYDDRSETLEIEILNATYTKIGDVNSYVRFRIFTNSSSNTSPREKYCSKVIRKTQQPMFEDPFNVKIPRCDVSSGGFIQFYVKHGYTCWWTFLGEAFLPLAAIPVNVENKAQIKLTIAKIDIGMEEIMKILNERNEKSGKKFVVQQLRKISK